MTIDLTDPELTNVRVGSRVRITDVEELHADGRIHPGARRVELGGEYLVSVVPFDGSAQARLAENMGAPEGAVYIQIPGFDPPMGVEPGAWELVDLGEVEVTAQGIKVGDTIRVLGCTAALQYGGGRAPDVTGRILKVSALFRNAGVRVMMHPIMHTVLDDDSVFVETEELGPNMHIPILATELERVDEEVAA